MFLRNYKNKKSKLKIVKSLKLFFLITAFTSTFIAISISLFIPSYKHRLKFQFSDQISLPEWQFKSSNNIDNELNNKLKQTPQGGAVDARRYFYTSSLNETSNETLRVEVMYIKGFVAIPEYLNILNLKYISSSLNIRYSDLTGYYTLFVDHDRAYLSSCINPRGKATVTKEQFINNRNAYDITGDRIISYLLGTTDLRDIRCLFTIMSVPLDNRKINEPNNNLLNDTSYRQLEKSWTNWYQKWDNKFPKE